jgi:hypothetical protein
VLAGVVVVAFSRSPYLLTHGRFWAEEGTIYVNQMLAQPGPASLAFVAERTGYTILFANIATWLAANGPLGPAPLVTVWLSLGVLVVLVAVVLRWPSDLLTTKAARLAAAALLIVGTSAIPEVWLTSINMTTAFGILAVVLLFVRVEDLSRRDAVVGAAVLALAALSGIYAAALAPLFVFVAIRARSRRRWAWAGVVSVAAVVQALLLVRSRRSGAMAQTRLTDLSLDEVVRSVGGLHLGGFALGAPAVNRLADAIDERSLLAAAIIGLVVLAVVVLLAAITWRAPDRRVPLLLAAAFVIIEVAVLTGSLAHGAPNRYAVVPVAIVTLLLIHGATTIPDRWLARGAAAMVALSLVAGLAGFWTAEPRIIRCLDCPEWAAQVETWQAGGSGEIRIWPYESGAAWTVTLPDDRR